MPGVVLAKRANSCSLGRVTFHTEFTEPGEYRLFVQVRVDAMLHTVPVTVTVRERAPGT